MYYICILQCYKLMSSSCCMIIQSAAVHELMLSFQSGLPGFYDPCVGEEKSLKVLYQFRGVMHQVLSGDAEPLRIPKQCKSHVVQSTQYLDGGCVTVFPPVTVAFSYCSAGLIIW